LVFGGGSASLRTPHNDLTLVRADGPFPGPAPLIYDRSKNGKVIRLIHGLIGLLPPAPLVFRYRGGFSKCFAAPFLKRGTISRITHLGDDGVTAVRVCNEGTAAVDLRIAAGTHQIESGKWKGHNLGVSYNNREQPDASLLDLRLSTQMLTKQLEELQQLRDRVNRAEVKAVGAWRRQRSWRGRQTGRCPVRRGSWRVR
jgi:hypothetical protein